MNELAIAPIPARMPSAAEWAAVMEIVRMAGASDENLDGLTHWDGMYHWSTEPWKQNGWYGVQRPRDGCRRTVYPRDTRTAAVGFRPVFDACGMAPGTPDGSRTPVGTLYMDGEPVYVDASNVESYKPGAELVFRPVMSDPAYVVHAVKAGDVLVADRVVLKNVSWDDLAAQGFADMTDGGASERECANMRATSDSLGDVARHGAGRTVRRRLPNPGIRHVRRLRRTGEHGKDKILYKKPLAKMGTGLPGQDRRVARERGPGRREGHAGIAGRPRHPPRDGLRRHGPGREISDGGHRQGVRRFFFSLIPGNQVVESGGRLRRRDQLVFPSGMMP